MGNRPSLASGLTVFIFILVILVPLFAIGTALLHESLTLYQNISQGEINIQESIHFIESYLPIITDYLEKFGINIDKLKQGLSDAATTTIQYIASKLMLIGQNIFRFGVLTLIMLYLLYFFLRDSEFILDKIIQTIPLGQEREKMLFNRFASVSRATLKGTFVVALVQGSIGGLLFFLLDIRAPIFWGMIMTILSIFPAIGSSPVWGVAAIILLASGQTVKGIILLLAGIMIIGLIDNILRPLLVGRDTQLPDYLVLLSTLGGLALIGISGFIVGPIIAALFLSIWEMFGQEFGSK